MEEKNFSFEKVLLFQLAKKINEKVGAEVASAEDPVTIYENLDKLCEVGSVEEIGFHGTKERKFNYMPKAYKTMLLRLIDPKASVVVNADWTTGIVKDGKKLPDFLRVSGHLYVGQYDKPAASYGKQFSAKRLLGKALDEADPDEVAIAESTARGIVETRLLTSYGIGAWISGEVGDDPEIQLSDIDKANTAKINAATAEEKKEVAEANGLMDLVGNEAGSQVIQETTSEVSEAEADIADMFGCSQEVSAAEEIQAKHQPVTDAESKPEKAAEEKAKRGRPKKGMTLEQAREVIADTGVFDGTTLGRIELEKPSGLRFVYKSTEKEQVKEAIAVIVQNNAELNNLFLANGIKL